LSERALIEGYFHCAKCGFVEYGRDRSEGPEPEGGEDPPEI